MPLGDVTEQQRHISSYYGADSTQVPASFDVALYTGDPTNGGVEVAYPGYARVTLTNDTTTFVPGTDGSATATASFPDATDAATSDDPAVWVLFNGTAIDSWDFLASAIAIDGPGVIEDIEVTPYIPNSDSVSS